MTREAIVAIVTQAAERTALTARQTAEVAWYPGHSLGSIDAIEALITRHREEDAEACAAIDAGMAAAARMPKSEFSPLVLRCAATGCAAAEALLDPARASARDLLSEQLALGRSEFLGRQDALLEELAELREFVGDRA